MIWRISSRFSMALELIIFNFFGYIYQNNSLNILDLRLQEYLKFSFSY